MPKLEAMKKSNESLYEAYKTRLKALQDFAGYIKRMAYGYQKIEYFMLKILQRCGCLGNQETN